MSPDTHLEALLKVLIGRFGQAKTLGEVYAKTHALRVYREGGIINLSEVSEKTGIPKQNLSRWLKKLVRRDRVSVCPHPEDGRVQEIDVIDLDRAGRHLPAVAATLGIPMDSARSRESR